MKSLVDFSCLFFIYVFKFYKKWRQEGKDKFFLKTVMYVYLSFVLYFTLMPILFYLPTSFNHPYKSMNFIPFIDVIKGRGDFLRQIGLNILMTVPFGFLVPLLKKEKTSLLKVLFFTFLLSLSIEILQPFVHGVLSADITDIITNCLGGMIGYIFYLLFKSFISKLLDYLKQK